MELAKGVGVGDCEAPGAVLKQNASEVLYTMKSEGGDERGNTDSRDALLYQLMPQHYQYQHQHGNLYPRDFYLSKQNMSNQQLGPVLSQHHLSSGDGQTPISRNERLQKRVRQKLAKRVMSQTNFTPNNPAGGLRQ